MMEENTYDEWLENCLTRKSEQKNSVKQKNLGKDNLMSIQVPVTQNFSINGTEFSITTTDSILTNSLADRGCYGRINHRGISLC